MKSNSAQVDSRQKGWLSYWSEGPSICINQRHREVYCALVANGLLAELARFGGQVSVLDYGCGDSLVGRLLHDFGHAVTQYDPSPRYTELNRQRLAGTGIRVAASPDEIRQAAPFRGILLSSVIQYLPPAELSAVVADLRQMLADDGLIVLTDVIPTQTRMWADVAQSFGGALVHGYVGAYFGAWVRRLTKRSYASNRAALGLHRYDTEALRRIVGQFGLNLTERPVNYGIFQRRRTYVCHPSL